MATKQFDITKVGPMSYRQLLALNNNSSDLSSLIGEDDPFGLNYSPTLYDPIADSPELVQSSIGNWGDSIWDENIAHEEEFQRLGDVRANNQPGIAKLGAGISKGLILAGTTFVDGTLGLAYGLTQAVDSWSQGEGFMKGASKLWDNEISNAMSDINKKMEEWLPNYRTQAEIEGPWYKNLDTMNFWADTFIKNLGFTVGAFYSGAAWTKGLKALKILKGGMGHEVVGSLLSAINEGRIEANHNVGDWLQLQTMQLEDAKKRALGQLNTDDPLYYANVALIENSYKKQMLDLNDRAAAMGNGILLANTILLSYTNFKTFGKMYSQGAKNAFKNAAGQSKRDLEKRIIIQDGKYVFKDITKKEAVLQGLQTGAREGLEEMNQAWISETMGNYKSPDSPDAYYRAMLDEDANILTTKFLEAASLGFINTYGNGQKWEEFVVGALTGLLGMPTVGKLFNSGENTYLGKGKWIGLSGGFFGELRKANLQNAEGNAAVNIMNQYAEKIRTQKGHFVQDEHFINVMNGYAAESNTFEFKNAEDNSDFAAIASYARVGRLNDLLDIIDKDFENISDEELESIARNTTRPDNEIQGWKNSDGSFMYETEEGKALMRKELAKKRDKIKNNIEKYEDAVDDVRAITQNSTTVTEDLITELAWLHWKIGRFDERYDLMRTDYKDIINQYSNILSESLAKYEQEYTEHSALSLEDLSRVDIDKLKETTNIILNLKVMIDFLKDILYGNSSPLKMASLLQDENYKKFVDTYLSVDAFELFSSLANNSMEYSKLNSLHSALSDIVKIADAAKTFNDRYKEFIEDPLKLQLNRDKLEHLSNSKRKNKQALNLAEKINATEKLEDIVDNEHFDEALQVLKDIEERTPEQEAAIDRMVKLKELDAFKDDIFDIVNSLDGVDAQVQADVQTLLESIEKREDLLENSEIYLDLNRIYREEEHVGKSDAHRNSDLEDRMAKAQMAILEAEKQFNEKAAALNSMGNGSLSNVVNEIETTGSDATTKVEPIATAGEIIPKTNDALNDEAEVFLSYLDIIDNTKKQELKNLIIEKVLKHLKAKPLVNVSSMVNVDDINTLVTNFESAFLLYLSDKISPENDRNPINPEKESSELKEELPQNSEKPEKQGLIRMYWRSSISRLPIYAFDKTNPLLYLYENDALLLKHYNQPQITYIKAVGEYLKNTGAFDRTDNGLIKDNEKIYFATDPELNKKAGAFVILLVDENNNVLGNLPTGKSDNLFEEELDKLAGSYIGLDTFSEAFKNAYNKDNSKTNGLWIMPKVFSVIDNWMIGKTIYSKEYNTIETIFSSTDSTGNKTELSYQFAIGAVDRNGNVRIVRDSDRRQDTVEDREINKPLESINGLPYVLLSTGNNGSTRKYTAVPVAMKKIINDASLPINKEISKRIEDIFRLTKASTSQEIVEAKESLQEFVGAKFTIIVKDKSVELKALNSKHTWETVFEYTLDTPLVEAVFKALGNMVGKYRYLMALKHINKKLGNLNYNDLIKNVVETNLHVGLNHTLSNWFTIRPLILEGNTFKMMERKQVIPPKTTGINPARKQNAATDTLVSFLYKGNQMKIDTSDWNSLYFEDKGVLKKLIIRDSKGNLNTNSAKAAAYAFGVIQHQDMTKSYDTQWGYYNPTTLEFEEKPIDAVLSNVFEAAEQGAQKSVKTEFTTEELQEIAENKGMFKTPLHKRAWEALTLELKSTIIQNPIMFDSLAVKYNVKSKTFSVDIDLFIKDSALFRKTKDTVVEKWNPEEETTWLGKVLPQFNTSERLQIINALIKVSNSSNPEYAWGQFKKGVITIYQGAAKGTLYHEAFHAVTHTLLNDNEVKLLFEEAIKKYGDLTKLDLEENLAEDFRLYIQYEQDPNVSYIRKIFRKLKHFVLGLFGKDRHINRLFYKINRGNYANRKPSSTDAVLKYTDVQYEKELKEILAKAPRDEQGRLLAPNGKLSNLTERQYAQVRTKAFINWFGDWEKFANVSEELLEQAILVFERNPELAKIGTTREYAAYLQEIFPNSQDKSIYWHGSDSDFSQGFASATKGKGSGSPHITDEFYLAKQAWTVLQYVSGVNRTFGPDVNGFNHWNKLWWELKEIMSNGRRENNNWKDLIIGPDNVRQAIPNKKGIFNRDSGGENGKWLKERRADYGYQDKTDAEFFKDVFGIEYGKDTFNTWTLRNAEIFKSLVKTEKGIYPAIINATNPIRESGKNTYYEPERGLLTQARTKGNDAILGTNTDNEFNSDVAVVFNALKNVHFLGTTQDIESFKQWLENNRASKVVDENGEPMVVYHGGAKNILEFKPSDKDRSTTGYGYYTEEKTGRKIPIDSNRTVFFSTSWGVAHSYALTHAITQVIGLYNKIDSLIQTTVDGKLTINKKIFNNDVENFFKTLKELSVYNPRYNKFLDYINSIRAKGSKISTTLTTKEVNAFREMLIETRDILSKDTKHWNIVPSEWEHIYDNAESIEHEYNNDADIARLQKGEIPKNILKEWALYKKKEANREKEGRSLISNYEDVHLYLGYYDHLFISLDYDGKDLYLGGIDSNYHSIGGKLTELSKEEIQELFDIGSRLREKHLADLHNDSSIKRLESRSQTYGVFLNIRNPFKHDYEGTNQGLGYKESKKYPFGYIAARQVDKAIRDGYDGVIYENLYDPYLADNYGVFNPNQIKSATDNIGTFSRENNNIYYRKLETLFELQNLKDELQYIKLQLYSTETIPEVKELYRKWREVLKIKERLFYYNGDVQGWIDDNGYQDVAEPFMKNNKEGYVKAFTREVIKEKADQIKALNTQYLKEQQQAIQNRISYLEKNKDTFISDEALSFQEEQEYVEIMLHYLLKTQFKNLTQEEQEFITSREISEKEYNDLTLEEREHLLFCR